VQSRDNALLLHLLNDTWVPALGSDCEGGGASATRALLRALESAQSEPHGWNAVVRPALGCEHVVRVRARVRFRVRVRVRVGVRVGVRVRG
jgi:hypothetical protein